MLSINNYLSESRVKSHSWVISVLSEIKIGRSAKLLFNDQSLFQQFESASQKFILNLEEVAFAHVHFERFVDDGESRVILNILPTTVTVSNDAFKEKRKITLNINAFVTTRKAN